MENFKINTVKSGGTVTEFLTFGSGNTPFVMLPGISLISVIASAEAVAKAYAGFCNDYTVYLFDHKRPLPKNYTTWQMADDVAEILTQSGIKNACVFGASHGGMMGLCLAARHPELVKKLVLGSANLKPDAGCQALMHKWIQLAKERQTAELLRDFWINLYPENFIKANQNLLRSITDAGTPEECDDFAVTAAATAEFDFVSEVQMVKCPVLFTASLDDKIMPPEFSFNLAKKSGWQTLIYQNYGHAAYDMAPDYKKRMLEFFENNTGM